MGLLSNDISLILEKYPQFIARIEELYREDLEFQELCADYYQCKKNLWEYQRKLREGQNTIKDYEDVSADLEKELYNFLTRKG